MSNENKNATVNENQEATPVVVVEEKKGLIQKGKDAWKGFKEKHPTAAKVVIGVGVGALAIGGGALVYNAGKNHGIAVGQKLNELNELPAPEIPELPAAEPIAAIPEAPAVELDLGEVSVPDVSEL